LTHAHKGDYLTSRIAECLHRYGIDKRVLSVCLDNARNNDTLVDSLSLRIPSFCGSSSRVCCLAHVINLMAKPPRRKKVEQAGQQAPAQPSATTQDPNQPDNEVEDNTDDVLQPETDPDKQEHEDGVVQKIVQRALDQMALEKVVPMREQIQEGCSIMTKVAGLARREMAAKNATSEQRMLTERVDTRWDTDYDSLESRIHFKTETQLLTADTSQKLKSYKLKSYVLSEAQWALGDEMLTVLEIFKERTKRFSLAEVPLLHETLPELTMMRSELEAVCNDSVDMSPLTQVVAQAALLVYNKYIGKMTAESEMYYFAIAMCPTLKLKWFLDNGYPYNEILKICNSVIRRFYKSYSKNPDDQQKPFDPQHTPKPELSHPAKATGKQIPASTHSCISSGFAI
ncbi:hypothetical protein FRC06_005475, partial [Ceratobasidium sp. 370]